MTDLPEDMRYDMSEYLDLEEKKLGEEQIFHGYVVDLTVDTVSLPDGTTGKREVVHHNGGVTVLPIDEDGNIIMVRQWRHPIGKAILEIPAGKLEKGEDPYDAGLRELREETGYTCSEYRYLGMIYASPGYCTEKLYLYLARGLTPGDTDLDEGEFVHVEKIPFDTVVDMILRDELHDSKTIAAVLKVKAQGLRP